jgi:integrase
MTALVMGMRASEIVSRVVRDLDDGGALLWIPDSKTLAGRRKLQVPEFLQPYLVELARGRDPQAALFGEHWRDWLRKWVQRICKGAGVPKVAAHGMRGLHGTLAVDSGITSHAVASALGHESFKTTAESYASARRWRVRSRNGRWRCSPEGGWRRDGWPPQYLPEAPPIVPDPYFQPRLKKPKCFCGAERDRTVGLLNAISG